MALPMNARDLKMGDPLEVMIDGTLFKALFHDPSDGYRVTSRTPVEGRDPLVLSCFVSRDDAKKYAESNFTQFYSVDTAALKCGIIMLTEEIPVQLRKLNGGELVKQELEAIEGFGSF